MDIGRLINEYRTRNKMSMQEFADKAGVSKGYISMLEKGRHPQSGKAIIPSIETANKIAKAMNMSIDEFLENTDGSQPIRLRNHPVYDAAAGEGLINDGYSGKTMSLELNDDEFLFEVKGDSMEPILRDGDTVVVSATNVVESDRDIMLVRVNGDECTLKHVKYTKDGMYLIAENPAVFPTRFFTPQEVEQLPVTIAGVVVRLIRDI